jgi:hypothetical protein
MNTRLLALTTVTLLVAPYSDAQAPASASWQKSAGYDARMPDEQNPGGIVLSQDALPPPLIEPSAPEKPVPPVDLPPEASEPARDKETSKPSQGLAVRVEKLQSSKGSIDPSQVTLLAPFPAKPLVAPPAGWRLVSSENTPPFTRMVELSPGNQITLTVRPHLLVPETNDASLFAVPEPGFNPSLGYLQNTTVASILSHSIRQLDIDSKHLGATIDTLQQILVSLPKSETTPETKPEAKPEIKPETKPETKPEAKPETKPEAKPETKTAIKPASENKLSPPRKR